MVVLSVILHAGCIMHQDHIIDIEKQSQAFDQYTRRNNLEISGVPNNI